MTPLRRLARPLAPVAVVLAVAGVVVVGMRSGGADDGPTLPTYTVEAATPATRAGLDVRIRPGAAVEGRVAAWPFALVEGEDEPTSLDATVDVARDGVVHVRAASPSLTRVREVRVVVAPAGATKFDDALARARTGTSDPRVRVVTVPVGR